MHAAAQMIQNEKQEMLDLIRAMVQKEVSIEVEKLKMAVEKEKEEEVGLFQHHSSWFWCPQECNHKPFDHPQGGHRATNFLEPTFLIFSVFHMVYGCCVGSRLFDGRPQTVSPWHWLSYFRVNLSNTLYKKYKVQQIQSTEYKFKHCC